MSELLPIHSQPEILRGGQLRDYQLDGLNWLASLYCNGIGGILADEMGLGKTVQTVAFLGLMMQCGTSGPFLLLVPKSTMGNWQLEVQKWIPTARLLALQGTAQEREELISSEMAAGRFDILLTSYEVFLRHKHAICRVRWRYVAIDEAHRIKNEDSQLAQVARELKTCGRLLITGTPLQNNVHELWALLNFVLPDEFHSSQDFENLFRLDSTTDAAAVTVNLQGILGPFMLRRLKRDVERSLLPKQEINVYIPLSSMQRNLYSHILKKDLSAISGKGGDRSQLLNIVMQLRKACNHPYLFEGQEPGPPYVEGEHLVDNAGKMKALDQLLKKLHANHSRVLLFCQMTRMLDIIEDYCNYRNFTYCRIDGQSVGAERQESIAEFMKEGSDRFLFLLSTRAGGLGLNLQAADKVVLYDSDWNPQADIQIRLADDEKKPKVKSAKGSLAGR
ncbi:hypothetical protein GUITHDRAFT_158980 [Guillardia theta CCMP2712]|uniref:Uncharacterized protein n=1 Tax=Guillardia theta (strain CCMP2712) TaxID=905079 RepID=L1I8B6_GUITC|nr:hypothetical protein GUITHDRAFT_158980 [Guillardia theta CCMP2712]EKX32516.1 hypothetical protein GUITHDRAFT_158980 [Guillardia theta CCMP2712]|eukprot:XP_005819496.1 hypothetical protein GUITHDRAFT_158980 [Guillardia theta CCMP2712]